MPSLDEFLSTPDPPQVWICDPYIARESITFLHGKTSIGKSPLTWELARCVSQGIPFLGWPTYQSRVLYIEADTPGVLVKPRLRSLPEPRGAWWIECIQEWGLDLSQPRQQGFLALRSLYDACKPELVIWNTLRSLTRWDLSRGETVSSVYQTIRTCFPTAAHLLVHHNRKESLDPQAKSLPDEEHSGSGAWRDTAQIVLHLRSRGTTGSSWLSLEHTKTQGSPMMSPLRLELADDGTRWARDTRLEQIMTLRAQGVPDGQIWPQMSMSRATFYRLLRAASA